MDQETTDKFREHLNNIQKSQFIPESPYDHAYSLLQKEQGDFKDFNDLHSQSRLLANVSSDRLLVLLQKDVFFEASFFDMGRNDDDVMSFFKFIRAFHREELNLTRASGGVERKLQTFHPPDLRGARGFGEELQKEIERREREQEDYRGMDFYG